MKPPKKSKPPYPRGFVREHNTHPQDRYVPPTPKSKKPKK